MRWVGGVHRRQMGKLRAKKEREGCTAGSTLSKRTQGLFRLLITMAALVRIFHDILERFFSLLSEA